MERRAAVNAIMYGWIAVQEGQSWSSYVGDELITDVSIPGFAFVTDFAPKRFWSKPCVLFIKLLMQVSTVNMFIESNPDRWGPVRSL